MTGCGYNSLLSGKNSTIATTLAVEDQLRKSLEATTTSMALGSHQIFKNQSDLVSALPSTNFKNSQLFTKHIMNSTHLNNKTTQLLDMSANDINLT